MVASGHLAVKAILSTAYVMGLDVVGNISWSRVHYGSIEIGTYASVQPTADGGYVVASGLAWVARIDTNGGIAWQKSFAHSLDVTTNPP
jgi:hypothetical protein